MKSVTDLPIICINIDKQRDHLNHITTECVFPYLNVIMFKPESEVRERNQYPFRSHTYFGRGNGYGYGSIFQNYVRERNVDGLISEIVYGNGNGNR